jgi:hypothetical protein
VGHTIRVAVTATNLGGSLSRDSAQSAVVAATPPVNTQIPATSGTAREGDTLTADLGTWTGTTPMTHVLQWERCDATGGSCADVPGATATTFDETAADVGHTLRVRVTQTNTAASTPAESRATSRVVERAPANTALPTTAGTPRDGETLTADRGSWTGADLVFTYRWRRCDSSGSNCTDIPGATGSTYTLASPDAGHTVRVDVTATNEGGSATASSAPSGSVGAIEPGEGSPPAIAGDRPQGSTLTADPGTPTGTAPFTYTYQWRRCDASGDHCVDVQGATDPTYVTTSDDLGQTLRVVVTSTNPAGEHSSTSASFGPITFEDGTDPNEDLGGLPGSLVSDRACAHLTIANAFLKVRLAGIGRVLVRLHAPTVISRSAPIALTTTIGGRKVRRVEYRIDGRRAGRARGRRWAFGITPAMLRVGATQTLSVQVVPKRGKAPRSLTLPLRSARCATIYTATMRSSRTLILRIDGRNPLGEVRFTLPRALMPALPRSSRRAVKVGLLGLLRSGHRRPTFTLTSGGRAPRGVLLSGAGKPTLRLSGGKLIVTNLPPGTARVQVTLTLARPSKGKHRARRVTLRAQTVSGLRPVSGRLSTVLSLRSR